MQNKYFVLFEKELGTFFSLFFMTIISYYNNFLDVPALWKSRLIDVINFILLEFTNFGQWLAPLSSVIAVTPRYFV